MVDAVVGGETRRVEGFTLPMNVRFRSVQERSGLLIWGDAGVGEWSPFAEYGDEEAATWLQAALEAADFDFPTARRDVVPVNCTVPAVDPERAVRIVVTSHGCRTAKVKVAEPGQSLDADVARVAAVREALGPTGRLRVDANGGWDVETAVAALAALNEFDLEYAEQPVASVPELAALRRRVDVPIAADESIRRASDPYRVKQLGAADVAVLKVQPLGGVRACLRIAEELAMPVVVSSALESSIGLAAGMALAASLPELGHACGLATMTMLAADLADDPLVVQDGELDVRRVSASDGAVARSTPSPATEAWWLERLARCGVVLERRQR